MIRDEINAQNEFTTVSIMEILKSWQKGFDKVNELYGTDIHVSLNPVLSNSFLQDVGIFEDPEPEVHNQFTDESELESNTESEEPVQQIEEENETVDETETVDEPEPETVKEQIEDAKETIQDLIDAVNDTEGGDEEDESESNETDMEPSDGE